MANHIHDLVEILMMSIALGMDAFSLSIGVGLQGLTRRRAVQLCLWIGAFHIGMTLTGLTVGAVVEQALGEVTESFGAFLLIGLGLHMMYSTLFVKRDMTAVGPTTVAMVVFAAGVSVDALSVGFSLGLRSAAYGLASAAAFGFMGALMTGAGLIIGKRANDAAGNLGEIVGASILIGFGVHFLLI